MLKKITFTKIILVLFFLLSAGCGSGSDSALIRVVHGSPDAPNVDVYVNGVLLLENVPYQAFSGLLEVGTGAQNIQVNVAGTDTTAIDATLELEESTATTVIATNFVASIEPLVLPNDRARPEAGTTNVRALHGAPSAPVVDIYVTAVDADLEASEPTLSSVAYKQSSPYLNIPAGTYRVRVTLAGTKTVAIDSGAVEFTDQSVFTVIALDATGGGAPFTAIVIEE